MIIQPGVALMVLATLSLATADKCNETCVCIKDPNDGKTIIDCSSRNLKNISSSWWPEDTKEVNLSGNNIVRFNLAQPSNITKLILSSNKLSLLPSNYLEHFPLLTELSLSHNSLGGVHQDVFANLKFLRKLRLDHNELTYLSGDVFSGLENLEELSLSYNPGFQSLSEDLFKHNEKLRIVDLSYMGIQEFPEGIFFHNPDVFDLNIAGNSLTSFPLLALLKLGNLKYLDISETQVPNLNMSSLEGLNVEKFRMTRCPRLSIVGHETFGHMENLVELDLSNNPKLSLIDGRALFGPNRQSIQLPALRKIHLNNNALITLSATFGQLCTSGSLREFRLGGNPWMCDCQIDWMLGCKPINRVSMDLKCQDPEHFRDMNILDISKGALECKHESKNLAYRFQSFSDEGHESEHHERRAHQARISYYMVILGSCTVSIMILSAILLMKRKDLREWYKSRQRRTGSVYYVKAPQNNTVMNPYSDPVDR